MSSSGISSLSYVIGSYGGDLDQSSQPIAVVCCPEGPSSEGYHQCDPRVSMFDAVPLSHHYTLRSANGIRTLRSLNLEVFKGGSEVWEGVSDRGGFLVYLNR